VLRLVCTACKFIFLRVEAVADEGVTCPRCKTVFHPEEEELFDPEND